MDHWTQTRMEEYEIYKHLYDNIEPPSRSSKSFSEETLEKDTASNALPTSEEKISS